MNGKRSKDSNPSNVTDGEDTLVIIHDVTSFIDEIKKEPWTYFQAEPFVFEIQGKSFFEVEIYADESFLKIEGFEGEPVTVNVDFGFGSERRSQITLKGLSEIEAKAKSYARVLQELSQVCDFIKWFVEANLNPEQSQIR